MKIVVWFVCLFVILTGCTRPYSGSAVSSEVVETPQEQNSGMEVPLIGVTDGDTLKILLHKSEETVRLLLIDTPETRHPRLGKQPFGEEAKEFLKSLLSERTVLIEQDVSERDKYGRLLLYVYTPDGRSIQEELLKAGLARVAYVYPPDIKYVDRYRELEKEAHRKGVGIWSVVGYAHIGHEHGYHTEVFDGKNEESKGEETLKGTDGMRFIASKNSEVYHELNCPGGAKRIKESNAIYFSFEEEAIASGRKMCHSSNCPLNGS